MKLLLTLLMVATSTVAAPNIVIMLVDDMGVMDSSLPFLTDATGKPQRHPLNDYYRTPNMERLAARGVRFSQCNAMSVCSPTRIAIMTGQNAARHHTTNWINPDNDNAGPLGAPDWNWQGLKPGDVTLPALLRAAGYRTIHVGKGHFGPRAMPGSDPSNVGFDINVGGASIGQPGSYLGTENFGNNGPEKRRRNAVQGLEKYHGQDIFLTEALTLEAKQHVSDAVTAKKPFYLYFAQYAVHAPFNTDARFIEHYKDSGKPAPAQAFAALIEGMDKSLGDLLDHLDSLHVAENTLVLFMGDNGSDAPLGHEHAVACAAPLRGKKGSHYEGGVRVPLIAAWAKPQPDHPEQQRVAIKPGAVQSQLVGIMDIFPTVLAATQVAAPTTHHVDGRALTPLLTGDLDPQRPDHFLMHYPHGPHRTSYWSSLRDGDWKVIYHYFPSEVSEGSHYQLFNLKQDPFEQQNLAKAAPATLADMMTKLIAELERHHAQYPRAKEGSDERLRPAMP